MIDIKPWYLSRTIWASLVTVFLAAAGYAGVSAGAEEEGALTDSLTEIATALAGIVAVIGRLRATTKIG